MVIVGVNRPGQNGEQCPVSRKKPRSSGALRRVLSPGDRKGSISGRFGAPVGARSPVAFLGMSAFLIADRISTIIGGHNWSDRREVVVCVTPIRDFRRGNTLAKQRSQ